MIKTDAEALVDAAFDFLCERSVGELIEAERVLVAIDAAFTPDRVTRWWARFAVPARRRVLDRLAASDTPLGAWLPDGVRAALAGLLGRPVALPRELVDEILASPGVRAELRAVLEDTLQEVLREALGAAPGAKGLLGVIGWGTRAATVAGRSILSGLAPGVGDALEDRLRELVARGVRRAEAQVVRRLSGPRAAAAFGTQRRHLFLRLLRRTEADAARALETAPLAELDALVPSVLVHNLRRADLVAALRAELEAWLAELSTQTIGDLLDEYGVRDHAREGLRARAPLVAAFLASPQLARWRAGRA